MIQLSYIATVLLITFIWCVTRAFVAIKNKNIAWEREAQLLLVYACMIVVVRFTFFPFFRVDGELGKLVFHSETAFPFRINLVPLVHLFEYPSMGGIVLNVLGNTLMFVPLGLVFPIVYPSLKTPKRALLTGFLCSLCIELLQLPFYDRVSDVDDLILNTAGFALGYLCYRLIVVRKKKKRI